MASLLLPTRVRILPRPKDNGGCTACRLARVNVGKDYRIAVFENDMGHVTSTQWVCVDCPFATENQKGD